MLGVIHRRLVRMLPLLIASAVVAVGAYFVSLSAIDGLQSSQAEYGARTFGTYLVREVPDLLGVINGRVTSGSPVDTLATIRPIGSVFKYRIYDEVGNLKVDSSPYATSHVVDSRNSYQDMAASAVVETGRAHFELHQGDGKFLPVYYSEVMVPLVAGNRTVGVLSVLSDETETLPGIFAQFRALAGEILALILVAFCVPVALYLRKQTQLELARRRLRHTSRHDELTGALNRVGFNQVLAEQFEAATQRGMAVAVHVIDLDRFKDVNDTGGHALGDEVLKQTSDRVRQLLGPDDRLARLGADEFAVAQPYPSGTPQTVSDLAVNIVRALGLPFTIGERAIQIGASAGYAVSADGRDADDLIRAADVALHYAKLHARGRAIAFNAAMEAERQTRFHIETRLRTALANGEFELHFQPVFETESRRLCGFEALLRLKDEFGLAISPAEFIPVAEEVGLIGDVGLWVLREACRVARQWPDELFVAVNLSPAQFTGESISRQVREVLEWSGMRPERLELEVTESLLITDSANVLRELKAIEAMGPTLALDDFGTGYASLGYLWRYPFDKIKVDQSFMADLTVPGSRSREILATIIALGRVLNLEVTAEGVETDAQADVLRELRCDLVQGFLFGRPQPATEVAVTILKAFEAGKLGQGAASDQRPKPRRRHA
ncbi:MAG: bifunctional diguanylate cyclase/phosphodiesterase [Devosia sp.]|nr:bifunctional diguanylate cyclase/phosphodiesterase [Devosia sp.]